MTLETKLALIPLLPLLGFAVNGLLGRVWSRKTTALVALIGPLLALSCAWDIFSHLLHGGAAVQTTLWTWMATADLHVDIALFADRLTAVMLLVVTGVGSLIHLYSAEYMETEDRWGYARYFAYLNLFTAMMLVLVSASSLPLMFVGWEGVGLCSYLLIGFWYHNESYASAGRKAFIVNRVGDFGFLLGMFVLLMASSAGSLDMSAINQLASSGTVRAATLSTAAILLFVGACGKSAQIPLHVWLPDAMAGPTPVSALIHAATMVTAGVYMVTRLGGLFTHAPGALETVAVIGTLTAFAAAVMAVTERDLKKVLAYSTISQLGYMFVGAGTGVFAAGIFHLVTHAFFKALLFLGAGAVMHAVHTMDMRRMGGLRRRMPWTFWLFLIGSAALAGLPPMSGFFSKDWILGAALARFQASHDPVWAVIWGAGVLTAILTAFYIFRAVALTFVREPDTPDDAVLHAHDPGPLMLVPLAILGVLAAIAGFLNVPAALAHHREYFAHFLEPVLVGSGVTELVPPLEHGIELAAMAFTVVAATLAAGFAWWVYSRKLELAQRLAESPLMRPWRAASEAKFWFDQAYARFVVEPVCSGARALWELVDVALIDNAVNGTAYAVRQIALGMRALQPGLVNRYVVYLAGGAVVLLLMLMGQL
ncbi:MAG: NADH-quinone oxidoreductase subunit L [Planctomycetota bacterium]|nr:MAG: NADH-quinone oxidoreductase subunit L [Planctomycetota bacterium]